MSIASEIVKTQYERNLKLQKACELELARLPRGSITTKKVNKQENGIYVYYYWVYRHDGKVINKYISEKHNDIYGLMQQVKQRRFVQAELRQLKKEQRDLERFLRIVKDQP